MSSAELVAGTIAAYGYRHFIALGAPALTVLALTDGRYVEEASVYGEESYTASFPFAVTVVPQDLLGPGGSPPAVAPLP